MTLTIEITRPDQTAAADSTELETGGAVLTLPCSVPAWSRKCPMTGSEDDCSGADSANCPAC